MKDQDKIEKLVHAGWPRGAAEAYDRVYQANSAADENIAYCNDEALRAAKKWIDENGTNEFSSGMSRDY